MASSSSSGLPPYVTPAVPAVPLCFRRPKPPRAYRGMSNLLQALSNENIMRLAFCEWKEDMRRIYPSLEEEERRYDIFKSGVASLVSDHPNSKTLGLINFVDWTDEELDNLC